MRLKTIFIIIVTVIITVIIMQNADEVLFSLLFWNVYLSKLIVMAGLTLIGFIVGFLVGRPRKNPVIYNTTENEVKKQPESDTLSEEDRDYIN
jgi:putative membrane protein